MINLIRLFICVFSCLKVTFPYNANFRTSAVRLYVLVGLCCLQYKNAKHFQK